MNTNYNTFKGAFLLKNRLVFNERAKGNAEQTGESSEHKAILEQQKAEYIKLEMETGLSKAKAEAKWERERGLEQGKDAVKTALEQEAKMKRAEAKEKAIQKFEQEQGLTSDYDNAPDINDIAPLKEGEKNLSWKERRTINRFNKMKKRIQHLKLLLMADLEPKEEAKKIEELKDLMQEIVKYSAKRAGVLGVDTKNKLRMANASILNAIREKNN